MSFSIDRKGYELKRILAASLEAKLKDLQQEETYVADQSSIRGQEGETLCVHSSICTDSKNSGFDSSIMNT